MDLMYEIYYHLAMDSIFIVEIVEVYIPQAGAWGCGNVVTS